MLIVNCIPGMPGWDPIHHMVQMACTCLDGDVVAADDARFPSLAARSLSVLARRRHGEGAETCLLVGKSAADMLKIITVPGWRTRFRWIGAWIIDSFWTDWIPTTIRLSRPFDDVFITSIEDADAWESATQVRPTWLPWGSDVLGLGSGGADRPWDLLRVGRQPPEWDDDEVTKRASSRLGIRFHPRPGFSDGPNPQNYARLMAVYAQSKYLVAFSNIVNPTNYTHPTRDYLTGRWTDALASGAVVAGVAPKGASADGVLWRGATLDLGGIEREAGLDTVAHALAGWTPQTAARNHAMALRKLDWRWRFEVIAQAARLHSERLVRDLQLLRDRIELTPVPV